LVKIDGKKTGVGKGVRFDGEAPAAKGNSYSIMEAVVAVATMAALSTLPMTTFPSLCAVFCTDAMSQAHELVIARLSFVVELFPTGLMQFRALFCCWIAFSVLRFHRAQARFYRWFSQSGVSPAEKRGFGYFACGAFGFIPTPALTQSQFHGSCASLAVCLVCASSPFNHPSVTRAFLLGALVMYFLYFSQLFCESRAGGHSTIIIPLVLLHLICAGEKGQWSILLLKLHIALCYFSAGFGKICTSIYFGKFWGNGKALQYLFWEAMWSRPGWKLSQALQAFLVRRLWLNVLMANFTLLFQLSVPLALLDIRVSWFFFVLSFSFHAGILVSSNISFMPYWVPALLIFVFPHGATLFDGPWESAAFALNGAWDANPVGLGCVCVYLVVQAIATFGLVDLTYGDILPISCEPMFVLPRGLDDHWPKMHVFTSANCREAGHLEPYMHCTFNPLSKVWPMDKEAMMNLPSRTLIFMTLNTIPPEVEKLVHDHVKPTPFFVWSNVAVDDKFLANLSSIADILNDAGGDTCKNASKLSRLLALQRQCTVAFQKACLQEPVAFGFNSSEAIPPEKPIVVGDGVSLLDGNKGVEAAVTKIMVE